MEDGHNILSPGRDESMLLSSYGPEESMIGLMRFLMVSTPKATPTVAIMLLVNWSTINTIVAWMIDDM